MPHWCIIHSGYEEAKKDEHIIATNGCANTIRADWAGKCKKSRRKRSLIFPRGFVEQKSKHFSINLIFSLKIDKIKMWKRKKMPIAAQKGSNEKNIKLQLRSVFCSKSYDALSKMSTTAIPA
jgi:hypothetical protein